MDFPVLLRITNNCIFWAVEKNYAVIHYPNDQSMQYIARRICNVWYDNVDTCDTRKISIEYPTDCRRLWDRFLSIVGGGVRTTLQVDIWSDWLAIDQ